MSLVAEKTAKTDNRTKMYFRVDPVVRRQFRAVAQLNGETMERRAERLMREDIAKHLPAVAAS